MTKVKIDDLKQVLDIYERILQLIHTTDLGEALIEDLLRPFEETLTLNGVNLNERDL